MADRSLNPLESAYEVFPTNAEALTLPTATAALHLNRAHQLAAGVRVVCRLLRNSGAMDSEEASASLNPATKEGLLQLAELACEQFVDSLEEDASSEVTHG